MCGGLESRCVERLCGADGAVHQVGISNCFMRKMYGQTSSVPNTSISLKWVFLLLPIRKLPSFVIGQELDYSNTS